MYVVHEECDQTHVIGKCRHVSRQNCLLESFGPLGHNKNYQLWVVQVQLLVNHHQYVWCRSKEYYDRIQNNLLRFYIIYTNDLHSIMLLATKYLVHLQDRKDFLN